MSPTVYILTAVDKKEWNIVKGKILEVLWRDCKMDFELEQRRDCLMIYTYMETHDPVMSEIAKIDGVVMTCSSDKGFNLYVSRDGVWHEKLEEMDKTILRFSAVAGAEWTKIKPKVLKALRPFRQGCESGVCGISDTGNSIVFWVRPEDSDSYVDKAVDWIATVDGVAMSINDAILRVSRNGVWNEIWVATPGGGPREIGEEEKGGETTENREGGAGEVKPNKALTELLERLKGPKKKEGKVIPFQARGRTKHGI
jgi:hypothetical protein